MEYHKIRNLLNKLKYFLLLLLKVDGNNSEYTNLKPIEFTTNILKSRLCNLSDKH